MGHAATLTSLGGALNETVTNPREDQWNPFLRLLPICLSSFVVPVLVDLVFVFAPVINNSVRTDFDALPGRRVRI